MMTNHKFDNKRSLTQNEKPKWDSNYDFNLVITAKEMMIREIDEAEYKMFSTE